MSERDCDVLIVGSGIGGLTAAISAKLAGLKPILVEKMREIGGSSAMSGGVLWLPNNPLMRRDGIADSREQALTYLANFVDENDPASTPERRQAYVDAVTPLVSLYEGQGVPLRRCDGYSDYYDRLPGGVAAGRSLETDVYDARRLGAWKAWFKPQGFPIPARASESAALTQMGVSMTGKLKAAEVGLRAARGKLLRRSIYSAGAALQGRLLEIALRLGCEIHTGAPLVELDKEGGRVSGARIGAGGGIERIRARRGVLIAAGGFARNAQMRERYQRAPTSPDWSHANAGDTGEAIAQMEQAGAALAWMDESWWVMGFVNDSATGSNQIVPELHKPHIILVDEAGERFVNEAAAYMEVGRACYARNRVTRAIPAWAIMDSRHRSRYSFGFAMPGRTPTTWLRDGFMLKDESLYDLARRCGIDPAGLEATIARWNTMAAHGKDSDFAKGESAYNRYYGDPTHTPNPCMGQITEPPFFAAPLVPGDVGTCGGPVTDQHARVMRPDGSPVEGLYAAGNCAAPLAGPHYIGAGQSIASSAIFGMIAVEHMAG